MCVIFWVEVDNGSFFLSSHLRPACYPRGPSRVPREEGHGFVKLITAGCSLSCIRETISAAKFGVECKQN